MILTTCAACAAPLVHDAPRCVRCKTRYCDSTCQHDHWRRGHKQICKKIHRGGNAEQYHADKKYKEAVAVAVEKCADDTKGQTCYICTEAKHWKTKEGLVRGCACRGTAGFAHVSCLAEQAKILFAEIEGSNLDNKVFNEKWRRWDKCSLCEQEYHGVVACALGWACWKTYVGRPEADNLRGCAMTQVGSGLYKAEHYADAVTVEEAILSNEQRLGTPETDILYAQGNLASTYHVLGRGDEALRLRRDVYSGRLEVSGKEPRETLLAANNYAASLVDQQRFKEAKSLLRRTTPVARLVLGASHEFTLRMSCKYARAIYEDAGATLDDLRESVKTLEKTTQTARRVLGGAHPFVGTIEGCLKESRAALRASEAQSTHPRAHPRC